MQQPRRILILLVLFIAALAGSVKAQGGVEQLEPLSPAPSSETGQLVAETHQLWFIELASNPTAAGGNAAAVRSDKAAFRAAASAVGLQYQERMAFDRLWNGLSVAMAPSQVAHVRQLDRVKAIYPVVTIAAPEPTALSDPELATALAMTGADIAQTALGLSGAGIRVAVMDTGIDYHHPDLGGCFGPGCRVVTGWDFVGDAFNADPSSATYDPVPAPDSDPDDCNGHGTHVAGIVGANGDAVGVAPGVTFGAYRVFGCTGSTTADIMIAAMERALTDGMHVLNMSIGSAFQWPQYPTAVAASNLVDNGMVVVASIGNSGANGVYAAGAPGLGDKVIGVASFDNSHVALATFTVSPDDTAIGYGTAASAPLPPTSGTYPMARTGTASSTADACSALPPGSLAGQVALIRRGTCTFHTKSLNAQNAGAIAVVLYNNVAGRFSPTVAGTPPITIPVVAISDVEGVLINGRLAAGPMNMTWTDQTGMFLNPTGGLISSFSSYGQSPDLALKPDIGAPGGLIRSTYPLELGGYATVSGTSMSSPHVAGGVALLLEARPGTPASAVRGLLQNSADPKVWWGNPGLGFLDNVHRQGAGMLDIPGAVLSTTTVEPGKLALGESEAGPANRTLTIRNNGAAMVTYTLSHAPALSTGGSTFSPSFFTGFASASFSPSSVAVPAGGSATVDVTITANEALADRSQYGGYIMLSGDDGSTYRVPYSGFKGDYQSIVAMTPATSGFPLVGRAVSCIRVVDGTCIGGTYTLLPDGGTFDMTDVFNQPSILIHFDHQTQYMEMEIRHAATGEPVHPVFYKTNVMEFLPRNSTSTAFFAFGWDGTRLHSNGRRWAKMKLVPDGDYLIVVRVLKALGDPSNPAHWETWTSPVITIDRP